MSQSHLLMAKIGPNVNQRQGKNRPLQEFLFMATETALTILFSNEILFHWENFGTPYPTIWWETQGDKS